MVTVKIRVDSIKDSDGWYELIHKLKFSKFKKDNPNLDEDELHEKFYEEIVSKTFEYGEYANLEIVVDEDLKIIGGRIIPVE